MAWLNALSTPSWRDWLLEVTGGGVLRPGAKLDPFGTSWRVLSTQARRWLPLIDSGVPIPGEEHRRKQAISDLRAANLVVDETQLTSLGQSVLDRWDPMPDRWEFELPMGVALLQEALSDDHAGFKEMLGFWWDIRDCFGGDEAVLADGEAAILLQYLNRTVEGFNPWVALRDAGVPPELPVPWHVLEVAASSGAAVQKSLAQLRKVLDPSRRLKARVVFCRAMSLLFLRREAPSRLDPYLGSVRLPQRKER